MTKTLFASLSLLFSPSLFGETVSWQARVEEVRTERNCTRQCTSEVVLWYNGTRVIDRVPAGSSLRRGQWVVVEKDRKTGSIHIKGSR